MPQPSSTGRPELPRRGGFLARVGRLLLPGFARPIGIARDEAPHLRYPRLMALVAVAFLVGFLPSLPAEGVPQDLWPAYLAAAGAATLAVLGGVMLPRPGSRLAPVGAVTAAVAITLTDALVGPYFHEAPLVFTVVLVVDAIVQGFGASLAMVLVGAVVLPFMLDPAGTPRPDAFAYSLVSLLALAGTVWAYRELQARSAAALERSQARYRDLVERTPGVVYEAGGGADGSWAYVSPRIMDMLGFPPERFTDDPGFWWSRIHADDRARVVEDDLGFETGVDAARVATEYRMVHADGSVRWIRDDATLRRDRPGSPPVWSGILSDVTAERDLEARLRQAQRMEAVGRLAGGIAHDFNNLLTVIRGYGELIRSEAAERDADTTDADELIRAADRAAALTGQLLAFSRRGVLQPRVLDPAAVVGDLTPMLRRLLGDHVALRAARPDQPVHVRMDRSQLEQVVVNLAVNARDAMPDGGDLTVSVERVERPAEGVGPVARISVTDTGIGMDESVRDQIFEPFLTTKSPGAGTGLGLPTVLGIVHEADGRIACESAPGHGTTFRIDLPAVEPPAPGAEARPDVSAPEGKGRVLLVEDQPAVRQVAARMLASLGYLVAEAADGIDALAQLDREPALDILVTDVTMPGMLGPDLARRAVERRPGLPVLLITGYVGDGRAAVDAGPFHVLAKPFDVGALARAVRTAIDDAAGGDQPGAAIG